MKDMENETSRFNRQVIMWAVLVVAIVAAFGIGSFYQTGLSWGVVSVRQAPSVTVIGYAEQDEQNQIAYFSAGFNATDPDRDTAVSEVNAGMAEIIQQLEAFGIPSEDIQTQNLSVYRMERPPFEPEVMRMPADDVMEGPAIAPDQTPSDSDEVWQANNTVEVTLREVDRAGELADLLISTGATNVNGPRFSLDNRQQTQDALIQAAIENAREKAERIAESSGRTLGKIEYVAEGSGGGGVMPMYARAEGMGGGFDTSSVQPGTTQVSQTVTVTFSLR